MSKCARVPTQRLMSSVSKSCPQTAALSVPLEATNEIIMIMIVTTIMIMTMLLKMIISEFSEQNYDSSRSHGTVPGAAPGTATGPAIGPATGLASRSSMQIAQRAGPLYHAQQPQATRACISMHGVSVRSPKHPPFKEGPNINIICYDNDWH